MTPPDTSGGPLPAPPDGRRFWIVHAVVAVVLLVLHAVPSLWMRAPAALNDELTYLGFARFFAGAAALPSEPTSAFGAFGYSLFITPAFWLSGSFTITYHAVLILNGIFLLCAYPLLYVIGRRVLGSSRAVASGAAFIGAVYPSFLLFSNYATTENVYIPAFLAYCLVAFWYLQRPLAWRGACLGAATGFMYTLHSRSLGILAVATLVQLALMYTGKVSWRSVCAFFVALAVLIGLTRVVALHLMSGTALQEVSITRTLAGILSAGSLLRALVVLLGELFNLTVSSAGLFVFGLLFAVDRARAALRTGGDQNPTGLAIAYWMACVVCVFCVTAVFQAAFDPELARPDFVANGRYPEGVSALMIGLGATSLFDPAFRRRVVRNVAVCLLIIAATAAVVIPFWKNTDWLAGPGPRIGMLALVGHMRAVQSTEIWPVAAAAAAFILLWAGLARIKAALAAGVIGIAFIGIAVIEFRMDLFGQQLAFAQAAGTVHRLIPLLLIDPLSRLAPGTQVSYDQASWSAVIEAYYQLWCPDKRFMSFDSRVGPPRSAIVIAGKGWKSTSAVEVGCETVVDACLFAPADAIPQFLEPVPIGMDIGAHAHSSVLMHGVYPIEPGGGTPFRWTDGQAYFRMAPTSSRQLAVGLLVPMAERLTISVDTGAGRVNVFEGRVPAGAFRRVLPLPESARTVSGISITSETYEPTPVNGYTRTLGVQVYSICLLESGGWCAR